jgi:tRNA-splicing endonuclease subunit Sen34
VAWGRLGTGTKKAGLLCCWEAPEEEGEVGGEGDKVGEVDFYSLEWASFG